VLLFHAGFARFKGGFVGVDVFFVISGYLIAGIILRELADGRFSLIRFYERRVRRIAPALLVTIALVLVAGAWLFPPDQFENLGQSVSATTLFVSNMFFYADSGYFSVTAEMKPLLHTWSLGVEEQFYLLFPLLLVASRRWLGRRFLWVLVLTGLGSLGLSALRTGASPNAAFYWLPFRAWELLLGAGVATWNVNVVSERLRNALVSGGLAGIVASVILFSRATVFPGVAAALPTLGAVAVILGGSEPSTASRLLGVRPIAFLGRISYSLYLLHWPVFLFARRLAIVDLTTVDKLLLLGLTLGLSILSWRFVEQPFRSSATLDRVRLFRVAACAAAIVAGLGVLVWATHGMPGRSSVFASETLGTLSAAEEAAWNPCNRRLPDAGLPPCALGHGTAPTLAVWGDSHALAFGPSIDALAVARGGSGVIATWDNCPPLLGVMAGRDNAACTHFNESVLRYLAGHPEVQTVMLISRWSFYESGPPERVNRLPINLVDLQQPSAFGNNAEVFARGIRRTVQALVDLRRRVLLVTPVPEIGFDVPSAYTSAFRTGREVTRIVGLTRQEYDQRTRGVRALFLSLASPERGVEVVRVEGRLCDDAMCRIIDQESGRSLYRDSHHLSRFGADYAAASFDGLFHSAGR